MFAHSWSRSPDSVFLLAQLASDRATYFIKPREAILLSASRGELDGRGLPDSPFAAAILAATYALRSCARLAA